MLFLNKFKMQCNGFNTFCMEIFAFVIIIFAKWGFYEKKADHISRRVREH